MEETKVDTVILFPAKACYRWYNDNVIVRVVRMAYCIVQKGKDKF